MGIYTNGSIFGISIYNFNDDDLSNTLFEEKYDEVNGFLNTKIDLVEPDKADIIICSVFGKERYKYEDKIKIYKR
jgi:hypothetical protein